MILKDIDISDTFLNRTPIFQEIRARIDNWSYIKLKSFCIAKKTFIRIKRQPTKWEKIFARYSSDKGLISRMYEEL
jgi:hypothetical protein